jgi:hypothetical protein
MWRKALPRRRLPRDSGNRNVDAGSAVDSLEGNRQTEIEVGSLMSEVQ